MKKIVRLTERDLTRLIKRTINESLLLESSADSLNRGQLESTYTKYNNLGSDGTFDEIFKNEREQGKMPFIEFVNGCATKVSLAITSAGGTLPPSFRVQNGPFKGKGIVTSAKRLKDKLIKLWGNPDVKIDNVTSLEEVQQEIGPGRSGVFICTPCGFEGATGHATIWSWWKNNLKGGPLDDSTYPEENGGTIYFWGVGGTNEEVATKCGYNSWSEYQKANYKCKTN